MQDFNYLNMNVFSEGLEDCCPECANVVFYRKNHVQGYFCTKSECHYGFATSYIPEIRRDSTQYKIFILSLGKNWKQSIVFLSLKFNININETRKFKIPGKLLLSADAVKIFHVKQQLRERNIQIEIVPEYPYEVWDNNPQGEFPLSTAEAKELKFLLE